MATPKLGSIDTVDLRAVWSNEASDFTPWLANNLGLLGEALDLDLELEQVEASTGAFSLDILARETQRGVLVAIENQLDWSDHKHLGQLLTYAAAFGARILIWVAPHWSIDHLTALEWLNQWTSDEVEVYGVEVRAIRIGNSASAPQFVPVVYSSGWSKWVRRAMGGRTRKPRTLTDIEQKLHEFFQPLMEEMQRRSIYTSRAHPPYGNYEYGVGSSRSGAGNYWVGFYKASRAAEIYVWINNGEGDGEHNARIYKALLAEKDSIENELGQKVDWTGQPHNRLSAAVGISQPGTIEDTPIRLTEIREWMLEYIPKFKEIIEPRLQRIVNGLSEKE